MKKIKYVLAAFATFMSLNTYAKGYSLPTIQETFKPTALNRTVGYQLIDNGNKVVFVFDSKRYGIKKPLHVFISGSFNEWSKATSTSWEMESVSRRSTLWTITADKDEINIPGNTGTPEFKYYVIEEITYTESICGQDIQRTKQQKKELKPISGKKSGYQAGGNNLLIFQDESPEDYVEPSIISYTEKGIKDFDLTKAEDRRAIANFRLVPGTTNLFRGYHPYKMSRQELSSETKRIEAVNENLKENDVNSIITLSGNEEVTKKEKIDQNIYRINYAGNRLFINTDYNTVYYASNSKRFGESISSVVKFINTHPGAYYIHCRLGSDRTGTFSAVLGALCGASWEDIAKDYEMTNNLGIKEYRNRRFLGYSLSLMINKRPEESCNLKEDLSRYFIKKGYLTQEDINTLNMKLGAKTQDQAVLASEEVAL